MVGWELVTTAPDVLGRLIEHAEEERGLAGATARQHAEHERRRCDRSAACEALARGLLLALDRLGGEATAREIAAKLGWRPSTVFEVLRWLKDEQGAVRCWRAGAGRKPIWRRVAVDRRSSPDGCEVSVVENDRAVLAEANVAAEQQVDPGLGGVDAKDSPPDLEIGGLGRGSKGASEGLRGQEQEQGRDSEPLKPRDYEAVFAQAQRRQADLDAARRREAKRVVERETVDDEPVQQAACAKRVRPRARASVLGASSAQSPSCARST
jgi:hypothetical protein